MLEALRHPPRWVEWLIKLALVIGAIWLAINLIWPTCTFRYRLTVEVETPQGLKTGSSVIEAVVAYQWQMLPDVGVFRPSVNGEAVFVDLGDGRNLVVTLTNNGSGRMDARERERRSRDAFYLPLDVFEIDYLDKFAMCKAVHRAGESRSVPLGMLPTIVTFEDTNNPKSVRRVEPDDLTTAFGPGYSVSSAKIEQVRGPMTNVIEARLPWLMAIKDRSGGLDGRRFAGPNDPIASQLGYVSFKSKDGGV
ncbi:MAG: hypothetical protein ACKVP5_13975 [Aestuariivirga sp.]